MDYLPNQNSQPPSKKERRFQWTKLFQRIASFFKVIVQVGIGLLVLMLIIISYRELTDDRYVFEAFSVPASIEEQGFTGHELTLLTIDKMHEIERVAATFKDLKSFTLDQSSDDLQLEVMGMGLPINSLKKYIKRVIGLNYNSIGGSIKLLDDTLSLTLRVHPGKVYNFYQSIKHTNHATLDQLMQQVAEQLVKVQEPVILTYYLGKTGRYQECISLAKYTLKNNPHEAKWAHNVWGIALRRQGYLKEAMMHFQESIKIDPTYESPWNNWAYVLLLQGNYQMALQKYWHSLKLEPNSPTTLNNIGYCHELMQEYDSALYYAKKSLSIDPKFGLAYSTLSETYGFMQQHDQFLQYADSAMYYGYPIWEYLSDEPYKTYYRDDSVFVRLINKYHITDTH